MLFRCRVMLLNLLSIILIGISLQATISNIKHPLISLLSLNSTSIAPKESFHLQHRYSFNGDTADSIGGNSWEAILGGGAYLSHGEVVFNWNGTIPANVTSGKVPYVKLPKAITGTTDRPISIEMWVSTGNSKASAHLLQFGNTYGTNEMSFEVSKVSNENIGLQFYSSNSAPQASHHSSCRFDNLENTHVVIIYNFPKNYVRFYINGTLSHQKSTGIEPAIFDTQVNYLGVSLDTSNPGLIGSFDEFRIWSGKLGVSQIVSNYLTGPNQIVYSASVPVNMPTLLPTMKPLAEPTLRPTSLIHSLSSFRLMHRYSFNGDLRDSVGGSQWNATIGGGAYLEYGEAVFKWNGTIPVNVTSGTLPFVQLPPSITGYSSETVTIELWVTTGVNKPDARFFQFGNVYGTNINSMVVDRYQTQNFGISFWPTPESSNIFDSSVHFDGLHNTQIVIIYNYPAKYVTLYVNGTNVGYVTIGLLPAIYDTQLNYLGSSLCPTDPGFVGSINEFRIWAGALPASQVMLNFISGPDQLGMQTTHSTATPGPTFSSSPSPSLNRPNYPSLPPTVPPLQLASHPTSSVPSIGPTMKTSVEPSLSDPTCTVIAIDDAGVPIKSELTHRYSFNERLVDSVGGSLWNATIGGGAYISEGQAVFDWNGSSIFPFVQLPASITGATEASVTIEAWASFGWNNSGNSPLFQFGNNFNSDSYSFSVSRSPDSGYVSWRVIPATTCCDSSTYNRLCCHKRMRTSDTNIPFNSLNNSHIVWIYDFNEGQIQMYIDGTMVSNYTETFPAVFNTTRNYLGAPLSSLDSGLIGSIDEFRIWKGVLSKFQIEMNHISGPENLRCSSVDDSIIAPSLWPTVQIHEPIKAFRLSQKPVSSPISSMPAAVLFSTISPSQTTTGNSSEGVNSNMLSQAVIIGIVISAFTMLLCICYSISIRLLKPQSRFNEFHDVELQRQQLPTNWLEPRSKDVGAIYTSIIPPFMRHFQYSNTTYPSPVVPMFDWSELDINYERPNVIVGEGSFGIVMHATLCPHKKVGIASRSRTAPSSERFIPSLRDAVGTNEIVVKVLSQKPSPKSNRTLFTKQHPRSRKIVDCDSAINEAIKEVKVIIDAESKLGYKNCIIKVYGVVQGVIPPALMSSFPGKYRLFRALSNSYSTDVTAVGIVMRYESGGSLQMAIYRQDGREQMPLTTKLKVLMDVARGLAELHSAGIVHGDIKPENVLLSSVNMPEARLADFGLAGFRESIGPCESTMDKTTHYRGTPRYSAPEMLFDPFANDGVDKIARASRKTDMYAFSVLAWELLAETLPYDNIKNSVTLAARLHQGLRPPLDLLPLELPVQIRNMIINCWDQDRENRKTAINCWSILQRQHNVMCNLPNDIYLSHHIETQGFAEFIYRQFELKGLRVRMSSTVDYGERITEIEKSKVFVVIMNTSYQLEIECMSELKIASLGKPNRCISTIIIDINYHLWMHSETVYLCKLLDPAVVTLDLAPVAAGASEDEFNNEYFLISEDQDRLRIEVDSYVSELVKFLSSLTDYHL